MSHKLAAQWFEGESYEVKRMIRAVKARLSNDDLRDVYEHGADSGFSGFIYYTETGRFYNRHKHAIWQLLEQAADELGENVLVMISQFNVSHGDLATFENALVWFALEHVARMFVDYEENQ